MDLDINVIERQTSQDRINQLNKITGWKVEDCKYFIGLVSSYLDSCGYFVSDFNVHGLPRPDNWIKYSDKDFGQWLLDMARQYNMECGKEYKCQLVNKQ